MFPNAQDALPLPRRPNLERYKKFAKDLVKACKADDENAIVDWAEKWVTMLAKQCGVEFRHPLHIIVSRWTGQVARFIQREMSKHRIAEAHSIIARSHGFDTWARFSKHVNGLNYRGSAIARFEKAADAIIKGDLKTLKRLLREDPRLVHARSTRQHGATLLHYVSANGVEGYRQQTPANIVEITEVLLKGGAEIDAEADVYGGGSTTLGLVATSVHPFRAGVQNPLLQLLLDYGAEIDHKTGAGNRQSSVLGALANGRPEAAAYLAERGARLNLEAAAGVGRLDVVKSFFKIKTTPSNKRLQSAFMYASGGGHKDVVEFLLDNGVDLADGGGDGQTPLHWAVIFGRLEMVKLLLKYKPPLESRNMYGGTVLGQTMWSAAHAGDPKVYAEIIETLIAAGAKVPPRHVPVNKAIDDLLRRYGSEPEPTWYWYGEKPNRPAKA
ncbi:MAG TPA: ankyrin repeat domain-containing protein [Pyrinomonadaceae bacterium]|nr:ankyrin repeat domain-containing protein [Pyrinomonadaceae bacterium]